MECLDPHLEQPAGVRLSLCARVSVRTAECIHSTCPSADNIRREGAVMETSNLCSIIHGSLPLISMLARAKTQRLLY